MKIFLASMLTLLSCVQLLIAGDFYSDIATTKYQQRDSFPMEHPKVFVLPKDKVVNWSADSQAAFAPMEKIKNHKQLKAALEKLRAKHQVFLQ
ncbi:MAG: hypothetical protein HRT88_22445, partial [Lentisphaeraceae bacterium]|nr:hypothetical protein [Lentisphaeraceae bacterium]